MKKFNDEHTIYYSIQKLFAPALNTCNPQKPTEDIKKL